MPDISARQIGIVIVVALVLAGCTLNGGDSPADASSPDGAADACIPYGLAVVTPEVKYTDPVVGATLTPSPFPDQPLVTCTPSGPTLTPLPTASPLPRYADPPEFASTPLEGPGQPENLSLNSGNDSLCDVAISRDGMAVTWRGASGAYLTLHDDAGWGRLDSPVGGCAGVAISEAGRIHVFGASGDYTYSDDGGQTWAALVRVMSGGSNPRIVLHSDGRATVYLLVGETVYTAQQVASSVEWSARRSVASGVHDYDVAVSDDHDLVVVDGPVRVYRDGIQVHSYGSSAQRVTITARGARVVVGFSEFGPTPSRAFVASSGDGGQVWSGQCKVQQNDTDWGSDGGAIGRVYGLPTTQDQIVTLYVWHEPGFHWEGDGKHYNTGTFPFISIGHTPWNRCDPLPTVHAGSQLRWQWCGLPGIFDMRSPQTDMRLALNAQGDQAALGFLGEQWNGASDVYFARLGVDTMISAPEMGEW